MKEEEKIADIIGFRVETVIRTIKSLEKKVLLKYKKGKSICCMFLFEHPAYYTNTPDFAIRPHAIFSIFVRHTNPDTKPNLQKS